MTLEGSDRADLSDLQNKNPLHPTYFWVSCSTTERWFQNVMNNCHSTNNSMITKSHNNNNNDDNGDNNSNSSDNLCGLT